MGIECVECGEPTSGERFYVSWKPDATAEMCHPECMTEERNREWVERRNKVWDMIGERRQ